ncbi:DUF3253 domain-containing protein [Solirubrobacter sp. CPCC 204708]|uniref:DUF3253 domain-containing protein n=1 Tax=Solirubrobacter deserti TaxID=2282478 RepID=A0ABT4RNS8_9ACTN|nr:DUF3253 domain-containing protein [Solirubrobacter deserti]MBE2319207.1 DUF3253 domain-containing protein [Solirubrobacter deserti]MDA0140213.1 DUF3253 domain-containing protein [Solirubrobacter deserti]
MGLSDADIERTILALLAQREAGKTICPSEAARALADDFRPLMDDVRRVADGMEQVEITQKGRVVALGDVRGPIRLRLRT